jgi:hypothetical protein
MSDVMKNIKKEIKHIKNLGEILEILADEIEKKKHFDKKDLDLLVNIGTALLWKGKALDFLI